jgi:hypothetical protein
MTAERDQGFEVMRALRKGEMAIFNLNHDTPGEARLVERAFDLGACALTKGGCTVNGSRPSEREQDLAREHHAPPPGVRRPHHMQPS